jgi:hypothetical protein
METRKVHESAAKSPRSTGHTRFDGSYLISSLESEPILGLKRFGSLPFLTNFFLGGGKVELPRQRRHGVKCEDVTTMLDM